MVRIDYIRKAEDNSACLVGSYFGVTKTKNDFVHFMAAVPSYTHPRSRGTTKRTRADPLGTCTGATAIGTLMAARVAILLLVATSRGLFWALEQPKGSLFEYHPQMEVVFRLVKCWRKHIRMSDYGAGSAKPTWLYSGGGLNC